MNRNEKKLPNVLAHVDRGASAKKQFEYNTSTENMQGCRRCAPLMTAKELEEYYKSRFRVGQRVRLCSVERDPLERRCVAQRWRTAEVVQVCGSFLTLRFMDLKQPFSGEPMPGYCTTVLFADLMTGREAVKG